MEGQRQRRAVRAVLWRFVTSATRVVGSCSSWGDVEKAADHSYNPEKLMQPISWYGPYLVLYDASGLKVADGNISRGCSWLQGGLGGIWLKEEGALNLRLQTYVRSRHVYWTEGSCQVYCHVTI